MESKIPDENSDVAFSSLSVVDRILYFKNMWRDHWAAVSSGAGTDLNIVTAGGNVVKAHQCVLLPLSPLLSQLLHPSLSCSCELHVLTVILPDRSTAEVNRLLQLIYTGSCVIENGEMYLSLVKLMYDIGIYIPRERLSAAPITSTLASSSQSLQNKCDGVNEAIDLSKKAGECEMRSSQSPSRAVQDSGNILKSTSMDQFEYQSDEERATNEEENGQEKVEFGPVPSEKLKCVHCGIKFCSNQPEMYVLMHERSCQQNVLQNSEDLAMFSDPQRSDVELENATENNIYLGLNTPESKGNTEDYNKDESDVNFISEVINLEQNTSKSESNNESEQDTLRDESERLLENCYKCHICDEELEPLTAGVYLHYATVHCREELVADFGDRVEGDKCLDCGEVAKGLKEMNWFLVHMGVKHRRVEKYLPLQFRLGSTDTLNAMPNAINVVAEKSLLPDIKNENETMDENWAENTNCPVCEFNMKKFKARDKSDHLYGHFKDKIKDWFSGMKVVYDFPPDTCPQCKKEFKDEHCLYKHLGSVHNLYQTFIERHKMEAEKKEPTAMLDEAINKPQRVKTATKYNKSNLKICKIESKKKSKVSGKTTFPKTKEVSKHVKQEPSFYKQCRLCSKKFTNSHRLRYHYSLVHFSKELEVEMYPLFENNNGYCPKKKCPKVFKKFKFFMGHMGSIHREVDKYVESANSEDSKISQTSKKNDPSYCKAKYRWCPKCAKRSRSYNCVKHMVTHYHDEIGEQFKPNNKDCLDCDESFKNLDDLIHHVAEFHDALNPFCSKEELKFIEGVKDSNIPPPNLGKIKKEMVRKDIEMKTDENGLKLDHLRRKQTEKLNPGQCAICSKQTRSIATLLQHVSDHFRKELKKEFSDVLSCPELQVTCPRCHNKVLKKSFIFHIGATHKEVLKYAPWLKLEKEHLETQKGNIPVKVRSINSEGKGNKRYLDAEDDINEPPLITVNPYQANISAWNDSDVEVLVPSEEPSTSSVMTSSSSSSFSRISSSATTSLIPLEHLLDQEDLSNVMESGKKAFTDKN